ncbi:MAG: hypothetical protein HY238_07875 [Acidobacteria bacterium]|nr:hypothetical protein [Acidobacteriota bacterium]
MNLTMMSICEGAVCAFFILLEVTIIYYIWSGKIDLSMLISEKTGEASMSRFQLLVFTFVIAMSLFFVIMGKPGSAPAFKEIPSGILALLGISGSSYLVSKGIQSGAKGTGDGGAKTRPESAPGEKKD